MIRSYFASCSTIRLRGSFGIAYNWSRRMWHGSRGTFIISRGNVVYRRSILKTASFVRQRFLLRCERRKVLSQLLGIVEFGWTVWEIGGELRRFKTWAGDISRMINIAILKKRTSSLE